MNPPYRNIKIAEVRRAHETGGLKRPRFRSASCSSTPFGVCGQVDGECRLIALNTYKLANYTYPSDAQGLDALVHKAGGEPAAPNWLHYLDVVPMDPRGGCICIGIPVPTVISMCGPRALTATKVIERG